MPESHSSKRTSTILLVVALVAVIALSFMIAPKEGAEEGEAFGGTDAQVTELLEEHGAEPWFEPVISLGSGEIESGLFALQAAIGAAILGFALGNLRGRKAAREQEADAGTAPA